VCVYVCVCVCVCVYAGLVQVIVHRGEGAGAAASPCHDGEALGGLTHGLGQGGLLGQVVSLWREGEGERGRGRGREREKHCQDCRPHRLMMASVVKQSVGTFVPPHCFTTPNVRRLTHLILHC